MGANDTTALSRTLAYEECMWGELYRGTKAELQSIGIAVGMAFPGEPGCHKRALRARDPRGFEVVVTRVRWKEGHYTAMISLPGRGRPAQMFGVGEWRNFAPGVKVRTNWYRNDEYLGTADALYAAGLVRLDQLPGKPGMNKVRIKILPDGTPLGSRRKGSDEPGSKVIERAGKTTYRVLAVIPENEQEQRREAAKRAEKEWEARMQAMPRPKPLIERRDGRPSILETKDETTFRERALKKFHLYLGCVKTHLVDEDGYGYDDETLGEFERLAAEIEDLLNDGGIAHGLDEETAAAVQEGSPSYKTDAALQTFLKSVTSNLSLVNNEKPEGV